MRSSTIVAPADVRGRLGALADELFDLLVIGGGITGAGVARDAARRGLRVALVERDDLASGTSSRSSRLVHGGVRYLEHGHLGLVFEASRERRTLLRLAPHLVRPLAFTWPVYRGARVPRWKLAAGLALYDALALWGNVGAHRPLSAAAVLAREPALRRAGLTGGAAYWDAATDDSRLTLATALAAERDGAAVRTHAEVAALAFVRDADGARVRARVCDALEPGAGVEVRARVAVNCAGPWADAVRRLTEPGAPAAVLGAKGAHLTVPADRVGVRGALTLLGPRDGRVFFVLPAGGTAAGQFAVVGTTETPTTAGPHEVRATAADVAYLLDAVNAHLPDARLTPDDVVSAWAGVRPLAAAAARGTAGSGAASREHTIDVDPRGLVTVTGGKLTTYRSMAAAVVDACASALGAGRLRASDTAQVALPGGDVSGGDLAAACARAAAVTGDAAVARRLVHAHGSAWRNVWALAEADPRLAERVDPALPYAGAEFVHAVRHEHARTLADLVARRTPAAFETRDAGRGVARRAADLVAPTLGWDAAARARAVAAYDREASRLFAVDP